jgi:hypothetical protein
MAQKDDKAELIAELARARVRLSDSALALRHGLDFSSRTKEAFKKNPVPWMGGAAVLGLLLARLPRRTSAKKPVTIFPKKNDETLEKAGKAGLLLGILKIAFDFARPFILRWATRRFTESFAAPHAQPYRQR